jgi:hypothetical protein
MHKHWYHNDVFSPKAILSTPITKQCLTHRSIVGDTAEVWVGNALMFRIHEGALSKSPFSFMTLRAGNVNEREGKPINLVDENLDVFAV